MTKDIDAQFLCKDCARYNLCEYYHKRKEDSYICKYFHLSETYGMTNGEVIQALFPYVKIEDASLDTLIGTNLDKGYIPLQRDWWNAPYKKESEDT